MLTLAYFRMAVRRGYTQLLLKPGALAFAILFAASGLPNGVRA